MLSLLEQKPAFTEVIITGRYRPPELMDKADLVTEMREMKNYYRKGVQARKGIEAGRDAPGADACAVFAHHKTGKPQAAQQIFPGLMNVEKRKGNGGH
ncbi:MAG: cob(I)yrinic acid a,c-diamide adenosyltransferase [Desulfobacterales bacterium]